MRRLEGAFSFARVLRLATAFLLVLPAVGCIHRNASAPVRSVASKTAWMPSPDPYELERLHGIPVMDAAAVLELKLEPCARLGPDDDVHLRVRLTNRGTRPILVVSGFGAGSSGRFGDDEWSSYREVRGIVRFHREWESRSGTLTVLTKEVTVCTIEDVFGRGTIKLAPGQSANGALSAPPLEAPVACRLRVVIEFPKNDDLLHQSIPMGTRWLIPDGLIAVGEVASEEITVEVDRTGAADQALSEFVRQPRMRDRLDTGDGR